jgi:dipeptidyl aminopeptidase/acylaminoacyl peptidase
MRLDVDEMIRLSRVGEIQLGPDGTWVVVVVQRLAADGGSYVSDLWRVPVDGGAAVQLTRGDSKDTAPRFRADGTLGFLSNRNPRPGAAEPGDDQRMQVWTLPPTGEPVPVTDEPLGVTDFEFAGDDLVLLAEVLPAVEPDQQRKVAADRAKHGPSALHYKRGALLRHWQEWLPPTGLHLIHRAADGTRRDLTPEARHELRGHLVDQRLAVAPGGREVAVLWTRTGEHRIPESTLRRYDLATGAVIELGAAPLVMYGQAWWSPDGATLAAVRTQIQPGKGDVLRLWRFAGGDRVGGPIAAEWDAHPQLHGFTRDGAAVLCTADHEGATPLYRVAVATGRVERVTAAGAAGAHDQVHALPDGARAVLVRTTQLHPPEPFVVALAADATPRPLAALSGFAQERGAAIAEVENHWTTGDGGERVQYTVIRPRGVERPPVLFWIHGGPIGAFTDGWHWRWNVLVAASAGYAVVLPNPRGSTGRGQAFIDAVCGNTWGGACYRDLLAVADEITARPDLDGARMAAMGGSFGGYMVNWIGGQPQRFRAIVSHAGIFAFRTFHGTTDYPAYFSLEMGGPPWDDSVDYARYSPDAFAGRWKTPTLITHGEKDYRVPISEALLMYEALDARGIDVELLAFPDEGHWIQRPHNAVAWYRTWIDFVGARLSSA